MKTVTAKIINGKYLIQITTSEIIAIDLHTQEIIFLNKSLGKKIIPR